MTSLYDKVYDLFHQWLNTTDEDFEEFCDWISNQDALILNITGSSFSSYNDSPFTYTGIVSIDWGDNTGLVEYNGGQLNHSYSSNGNYTIKIYGNITALNYACFQQCTGLTSVNIPYNVTRLGNASFWGCSNLISVTLPNTITYIGSGCFADCTSLTSVNIPDSVTSMGTCFSGDTALTEVILNWNNASEIITYDSFLIDGCTLFEHFLIPQGTTSLYTAKSYPNNLLQEKPLSSQLKQKLKKLSFFTHHPKEHETLTINNVTEEYSSKKEKWAEWLEREKNALVFTFTGTTLTQDSNGSFSGTDMTIDYGDGTVETTTGTFGHTYAEDGTYIVKIYGVTSLRTSCFSNCTGLTSISIPDSVTNIGIACFYGCNGLTSVNIPNSVKSLRTNCFKNCTELTSISIPNSVTSLGDSCFNNCTGLTNISIPDSVTNIGIACFYGCNGLTSVNIPNSVTSLGTNCFSNCTRLTSISIPNSVTSIGDSCFGNCTRLTSISIPDSVTSIEDACFNGCSRLTNVNIPNNVTSLGVNCFKNCTELTRISIPNSVTSIGESCFDGCNKLTSISISRSITSIPSYCFRNCRLTSISIPNSVTSIGKYCFASCTILRNINIPSSITSIGAHCFKSCTNIVSVTLNWTNPTITYTNSRLSGCTNLTTIYIPHGTKSSYTAKSYPSAKLVER